MQAKKRPGGRSALVRTAIFQAAQELFTPGEPLPTLAQIALRAGVQKTTVYRRWSTVEALLHEALADRPRQAIPIPDTGSLREDLRALARAGHRYQNSDEGRSALNLLLGLPDAHKQIYWAGRYPHLRTIYERAISRGEIAPDTDVDLYVDINTAVPYFSLWAKGQEMPLARRYDVIEAIMRALGALRPPVQS